MTVISWLPDEGEHAPWPREGHEFLLKVLPEHSGGSFSLTEVRMPPGTGAGLHAHDGAEECWHILEGDYRFVIGDSTIEAGAGSTVIVPRGTPHGLRVGESGGRHLTIFAPAGCEAGFREISAAMRNEALTPEFFAELGRKTDTRFDLG